MKPFRELNTEELLNAYAVYKFYKYDMCKGTTSLSFREFYDKTNVPIGGRL